MSGFSQKDMMYGILGATLSDNKSSSDAKLSKNDLFRIGLFSALGGGNNNPVFSMLNAKLSADDKITANTATASNVQLQAEIAKQQAEIKSVKDKLKTLFLLSDAAALKTQFLATFDKDGNIILPTAAAALSGGG